ncbi:MAG: hypothetical protein ABSC47_08405 [Terracidiphilus sp.]
MAHVQRFSAIPFAVTVAVLTVGMEAKTGDPAATQQKQTSQTKLTRATTHTPVFAPQHQPADTPPPTIAIGQTKDQVIAAFGQPIKIAKLGVKEIFYYKDMKVTFTNGKVSNVE